MKRWASLLAPLGLVAIAFGLVSLFLLLALYPAILLLYGDPEIAKTLAGLLGLWLVGLAYAAVGAFASSLTRNQIIAFSFSFVLLLMLWMLSFLADLGATGGAIGSATGVPDLLRWLSTAEHFERFVKGLIDTADLAYFGVIIGSALLLTKFTVESVRWR